MEINARLAVVEREVSGLHGAFKDHERLDRERFHEVTSALVRIERILWGVLVVIAAINGPGFINAAATLLKL